MVDMVDFKPPLPDGFMSREFQTKSLNCNHDVYEVSEDGRLLKIIDRRLDVKFETPVPVNYTGELNICDGDDAGNHHEYDVIFIDGKMVEIFQIEY